jgi:phospholipase C
VIGSSPIGNPDVTLSPYDAAAVAFVRVVETTFIHEEVVTSMTAIGRRGFLRYLSSAAVAAALPTSIDRALAIPAHNRTGTINDVEHIVFLMQENRAFDHYFGTLRGVRGFGDPRAMPLPSGQPVWFQPNGGGVVVPFHPTAPDFGLQFLVDTAHG